VNFKQRHTQGTSIVLILIHGHVHSVVQERPFAHTVCTINDVFRLVWHKQGALLSQNLTIWSAKVNNIVNDGQKKSTSL